MLERFLPLMSGRILQLLIQLLILLQLLFLLQLFLLQSLTSLRPDAAALGCGSLALTMI